MAGDVELIAEERAHPAKLQDTFIPVHNCKLVPAHKLFATLSSEEFILFAFSYTESCRCSINVIN